MSHGTINLSHRLSLMWTPPYAPSSPGVTWPKQISPVPSTRSPFLSLPWSTAVWPHPSEEFAATYDQLWECLGPKLFLKKWCVAFSVTLNLQMCSTVVAIPPKHSWTTDDAYSRPFIVATLAYLLKDCHLSQDHLHPRLDTVPRQVIS